MKIVYIVPPGRGWDPITLMVNLAAELLEADLTTIPETKLSNLTRRLASALPRRRGKEDYLVIAATPRHLRAVIHAEMSSGSGYTAGWVIDSFWDDRIPLVARPKHFDHIFVSDGEVADSWRRATGVPTSWLPIGSDVLRRGSFRADRPVDLQRVGRMPPEWNDDDETRRACEEVGLRFEGRPEFGGDPASNQEGLIAHYAKAKFTLSFTNRVSPAPYTHPIREYLTSRWADALANGAVVAGIAPNCMATRDLLWPEATLEFDNVRMDSGMRQVLEAVHTWHEDIPVINHLRALQRLDWRWRFRDLSNTMGLSSLSLDSAMVQLHQAIEDLSTSVAGPD